MNPILHIAANHIRVMFKDRINLAMMVLVPLILSFVTGLAFGGMGGGAAGYSVPVAFVDSDGGHVARSMVDALSAPPYSARMAGEAEARELVSNREVSAAVFIPPGLEDSLRDGLPVEIVVLRASYQESPRMIEHNLSGLLVEIQSAVAAANLAHNAGIQWSEAYELARSHWRPRPPVTVEVRSVTISAGSDIPSGYNLASPGYVVMFGMMTAVTAGAATLLSERDGGTLGRLLSAPLAVTHIMAGKTIGIMCSALIQMTILIALGQLLFGVNWGANLPALAMLVVSLTISATGIGMLLAAFCRTSAQASATGVLIVLVMSMLGGTWWPLEVMPAHMRTIARLVPSGWAMDGFTGIIMRGAGPADVLTNSAIMIAFGVVSLLAGVRLFRYTP